MTKEQFPHYPDWLVKTLIEFNHLSTVRNEWELVDIAVDLQRQPDLPDRLRLLFESLQNGFTKEALKAGSFLALGYRDEAAKKQVFPSYLELGTEVRGLSKLEGKDDDEAAAYAFNEVHQKLLLLAPPPRSRILVIQVPYFVKKATEYSPDADGDISLQEFQKRFAEKQVLFTEIQRVASDEQVMAWVNKQDASWYEQRFIFTLGFLVTNGIEDEILTEQSTDALAYLIGAFLSWAGMGVMDSTRFIMASVAVKLAHFSHEFLRPFAKLRKYREDNSAEIPRELSEILDSLMGQAQMLEIGPVVQSGTMGGPEGSQGPQRFSFTRRLEGALSINTTFRKDETIQDGSYDIALEIEDQLNQKVRLNFEGLPPETLAINFEPSFFDRLVRNVLRNATQHSNGKPVNLHFSFEVDQNTAVLAMNVLHQGASIPRGIRRKLFKLPVSSFQSKGQSGIGLWTIGMAFEAQRLPTPEVMQQDTGVLFTFRFPIARQ